MRIRLRIIRIQVENKTNNKAKIGLLLFRFFAI